VNQIYLTLRQTYLQNTHTGFLGYQLLDIFLRLYHATPFASKALGLNAMLLLVVSRFI
jgi:hypothetical protein